jgi:hypothetical protein
MYISFELLGRFINDLKFHFSFALQKKDISSTSVYVPLLLLASAGVVLPGYSYVNMRGSSENKNPRKNRPNASLFFLLMPKKRFDHLVKKLSETPGLCFDAEETNESLVKNKRSPRNKPMLCRKTWNRKPEDIGHNHETSNNLKV